MNPMVDMKKLIVILCAFILAACGGGSLSTGPIVEVLDAIELSLTVDTNGEIHLSGNVAIPTPIHTKIVNVDWLVGFDLVLNDAKNTSNTLYLLYDDGYGNFSQDTYAIDQPFEIIFAEDEWVRKFRHVGDGNIVVFVERIPDEITLPLPNEPRPNSQPTSQANSQSQSTVISSCPGAPPQRVVVGDKAYVCTKSDRLIVHKGPGKNEPEITRIVTGTEFVVVKGPVCSDNWSFWRIRTKDGIVGWVSEGSDSIDPYFFCPR
jgi:hypothetical protein